MDSDTGEHGGQPGARYMDWAFTQSPFALAIHDRDLRCLRVNDRMCQMFGLSESELRGRRLTDVLSGPQYDALEHYMRQVLDTGEPTHRDTYRQVPGETRERAWSVTVSPLKDLAGRTRTVWIGVLDITRQHEARQRLTLLNRASIHIGTTLDVSGTAQELADLVVPQFADLAIVDLLDAVLSGDEPGPGPLTGTVALRRVAQQSVLEGVPEAVVRPGEIDVQPGRHHHRAVALGPHRGARRVHQHLARREGAHVVGAEVEAHCESTARGMTTVYTTRPAGANTDLRRSAHR